MSCVLYCHPCSVSLLSTLNVFSVFMCDECVYSFTSHMMMVGGATADTDLSIHVFDRVTVDLFFPPTADSLTLGTVCESTGGVIDDVILLCFPASYYSMQKSKTSPRWNIIIHQPVLSCCDKLKSLFNLNLFAHLLWGKKSLDLTICSCHNVFLVALPSSRGRLVFLVGSC